jgi:hypothetical protein
MTSTAAISRSHSSRISAARPAAFGLALQGTQYSIRTRWRSDIRARIRDARRCPSGGTVAEPKTAIVDGLAPYRRADGSYHLSNEYHYLIARA